MPSVLGSSGKVLAKQCVQKLPYVLLPLCLHPALYGSFLGLHINEPSQSGQCDLNVLCSQIEQPLHSLQSSLRL